MDDAIITKDLDGKITSWNLGAERLFGYSAIEATGANINLIVPADRQDEERHILARLRNGERIDNLETVRRRRDGSFVDISLTVSPVRDSCGRVIGASKIARDITERRRASEQQDLLVREMPPGPEPVHIGGDNHHNVSEKRDVGRTACRDRLPPVQSPCRRTIIIDRVVGGSANLNVVAVASLSSLGAIQDGN